jgi:hypothetical protein
MTPQRHDLSCALCDGTGQKGGNGGVDAEPGGKQDDDRDLHAVEQQR